MVEDLPPMAGSMGGMPMAGGNHFGGDPLRGPPMAGDHIDMDDLPLNHPKHYKSSRKSQKKAKNRRSDGRKTIGQTIVAGAQRHANARLNQLIRRGTESFRKRLDKFFGPLDDDDDDRREAR